MDLSLFVVAVLLIAASPGPGITLILRRAVLQGARVGILVVLGLEAGLYVWALLAAAGSAALVAASSAAYLVLKVLGGCLLAYLGARSLLAARRGTPVAEAPDARRSGWSAFGEGLLVQLANPKIAVFVIAFYPQFVPASRPLFATTALLALLQVAIELVLYLSLAALVARAGGWFGRSAVRRRLEAVSGVVLVGMGVRVAASSR